jgi:hypothetical protein
MAKPKNEKKQIVEKEVEDEQKIENEENISLIKKQHKRSRIVVTADKLAELEGVMIINRRKKNQKM